MLRVSVVMIFRDAEPYLAEAAASVLAQSWPELELVLVDDGGTDGSSARAAALAAADPERVRVVAHPGRAGRGTGPSRLLGIRSARGDLVAFLDADDVWGPGHLAHEVGLLEAHPSAGMVCGRSVVWRSWAGTGAPDRTNPPPFAPGTCVAPPRLLAAVLRNGALATPTCSLLVRRALLTGLDDALDGFGSTYEDQVVNTLLQLRTPAVISGAVDALYRQHPGSLTARARAAGADADQGPSPARRAFLTWLAALPELAPGRADPGLRALVERELAVQQAGPPPAPRPAARLPSGLRRSLRALRPRPSVGPLLDGFLHAWGEDVRGDVAVVGAAAGRAAAAAGDRVRRLHVRDGVDALAALAPLDTAVLTGTARAPLARHGSAALAGLPDLLAPGGTLLLADPGLPDAEQVRRLLSPSAAEGCVDVAVLSGAGGARVVTARVVRPA